jgi:DNA mismatch endonuclease, patch repair protein
MGRPDVVFARARVAIFLDGCFWHGCKRCRSIPSTNRVFWLNKIRKNRKRDKKVRRMLRAMGWKVMAVWEHELRSNCLQVLRRVKNACVRK